MACKTSTFVVTMPVFSDGSGTAQFITFKRVPVEAWVRARLSLQMNGTSGLLTASTAARHANVDDDFPAASLVDMPSTPASLTADGQDFGDAYTDLDTAKQMVEFGVKAYNTSGSLRQAAQVTLTIDLQE